MSSHEKGPDRQWYLVEEAMRKWMDVAAPIEKAFGLEAHEFGPDIKFFDLETKEFSTLSVSLCKKLTDLLNKS